MDIFFLDNLKYLKIHARFIQNSCALYHFYSPFAIRKVNDQLIQLERAFIDPQGLPGRPLARYLLQTTIHITSYSNQVPCYSTNLSLHTVRCKLIPAQASSLQNHLPLKDNKVETFCCVFAKYQYTLYSQKTNPFHRTSRYAVCVVRMVYLGQQTDDLTGHFPLVLFIRHVLFAESSVNTYAGSSFPGLADGMFEIEGSPDEARRWEIVRKHFSVILYTIESAASTLRDVHKFMPLQLHSFISSCTYHIAFRSIVQFLCFVSIQCKCSFISLNSCTSKIHQIIQS